MTAKKMVFDLGESATIRFENYLARGDGMGWDLCACTCAWIVVWLCFVVCCVKVWWWIYIFSRGNSCVSRYRNQEYHRRKVYDETLYCCSRCVQRYSNSPHGVSVQFAQKQKQIPT